MPKRKAASRGFVRRRHARRRTEATIPTWKRAMDVSLVVMSLPVSIPLILAVMLWIRIVSRGPALFRQERVGHEEKAFTIYKFRTMHEGAQTRDHELHVARLIESDQPMVKLDELGDSRMIAGACFLRSTGLDELPQLFNVLRGDMSLVGPRPCIPDEHAFFTTAQRERFQVLPGITGIWQISGKNRTTFREMATLDVAYARLSSPGLDLTVLACTPMAVLRELKHYLRRRIFSPAPAHADSAVLEYGSPQLRGDRS
ncbi:sugar transferase [Luteolibacter flavescens]|uniref:Sugar transferase n=1 Tax=Luteolibacter flavescens TaxID=1859460 RepID=A0ABT3FT11_9BACT|nr:sugar transferase [Luteolibacter flavescens]MCW1886371.1 sugar transferase [Luteolibacter flavescens]